MTTLLLVGASVRAAAWSALRCRSLTPWCVDLFADADLRQVCPATALPGGEYPHGLIAAAGTAPPGPWMYTGALENHPAVIEAISQERPLWGNPAEVVRRLRSPATVSAVLENAGISCPKVADGYPPDPAKLWLVKPRKSASGVNIRHWQGESVGPGYYCQEWIDGEPCSALYLGMAGGAAVFLGATRQLIGASWLHARPFRYCGSIGPLSLVPETAFRLRQLGEVLAGEFSLRGLFGVDFILRDGVPWPVEINPRYTASVEVLERAKGMALLEMHREVFTFSRDPKGSASSAAKCGAICGKAILFARAPVVFPADGPWRTSLSPACDGNYADIAHPGTRIETGHPVLTIFAQGENQADCLDQLRQKAKALDQHLLE